MIKVLTVVGARPQLVKAAAISRVINEKYSDKINEVIVHTGQHYDDNMSEVFFEQLGIPREDYNLKVGSASHAKQTADIMVKFEEVLLKENPDVVLLYGDTNSTVAATLDAAKLHFPIVHVEAGVRMYAKMYPEEVNRIVCDHMSTLLFVPTDDAVNCLQKEGFEEGDPDQLYSADHPGVFKVGDVMYDNALYYEKIATEKATVLQENDLEDKEGEFVLVTMHRPHNTDKPEVLRRMINTFSELSNENKVPFVFPIHPRTRKMVKEVFTEEEWKEIVGNPYLKFIDPVGLLDMIMLESRSALVMTDSGGVQKEAYFFKTPVLIMLAETPWPELLDTGYAKLVSNEPEKLKQGFKSFYGKTDWPDFQPLYGNGDAADKICEQIVKQFDQ